MIPDELALAILYAGTPYNIPLDILVGIWRIESGSTFPNNAVNPSGYGGLFGTTDWNGTTQAQANLAASILANLYLTYGNWDTTIHEYSSGKTTAGYGLAQVNAIVAQLGGFDLSILDDILAGVTDTNKAILYGEGTPNADQPPFTTDFDGKIHAIVKAELANITPSVNVDLTPVLNAIAALKTEVDSIKAQLQKDLAP